MTAIPTADGCIDAGALFGVTGWELKPEGLCRGDVCIPTHARPEVQRDGRVDVRVLAELLRRPLAFDDETGFAVIGEPVEEAATGRIDDLELRDVDGKPFGLRTLGRKKKVLVAWASW